MSRGLLSRLAGLWRRAEPGPLASDDSPPQGPEHASDADRAMMARALELARRARDLGEVPVGAVVYRTATGQVLGEGHNRREIDADPTAHAELIAIAQAARASGDWRLTDCTCVVTLEPCLMCAGLLVNARLGRLVYGADNPKEGAVASRYHAGRDGRLNHRVEVVRGVLGEESAAMLKEFFKGLRTGRGLSGPA